MTEAAPLIFAAIARVSARIGALQYTLRDRRL
jgi:hypothetical protein